MIIVDTSDGSKDLLDCPDLFDVAVPGRLDSADVMLTGHGPNGSEISVGVELKKVNDLVSSISTGRLGGEQIPKMLQTYDYSWLLVYGDYFVDEQTNVMQVQRRGRWQNFRLGRQRHLPWSYIEGFLLTLQMQTGVRVKHVHTITEAAKWLVIVDKWLEKRWDQHKALKVFNRSGEMPFVGADPVEEAMARVAACLPAVGWERGWAAARVFDSIWEMMSASKDQWQEVPGVGKVIARSVVEAIMRRKSGQVSVK